MKSQEQAIGFTPGMLLSNGYVAGDTLYVAGQQGADSNGKVNRHGYHTTNYERDRRGKASCGRGGLQDD